MPQATHVISNTIDFDQYSEAVAMMIPVVNVHWIKTSIARNKLAQPRAYSPDPRMIFSNIIITCADIPETDKETIIGATLALGGMESKDLTRQTTHICALSMDHPKCIEAQKKAPKCKIVLPHWFDDCFKLGKRIDETPYMLPDPEILLKGPNDEVAIPASQALQGATSTMPTNFLPAEGSAREKPTVFSRKKVMLSWDLPINNRLRKILTEIVKSGDGDVVDDVDACDMFVCQFRDGEQYIIAAQQGKDVGNLSWFYHLIVHNEWTDPLRRLLHYPIPRKGIPGFKDMKITLSNYGGDARIYLENLITASGATYTKTMKAENTHLITARMNGEKCEAAKDWNIEIVNHLWIEESYAKCEVQSLSNNRYHHFPLRTNLGEVIGQTFIDERRLRDMFYPGGEDELDSAAKRKRKISEAAQENLYAIKPGERLEVMQDSTPAKPKSAAAKKTAAKKADTVAQSFTTPAKPARHVRSGKENDTPSVVSSASRSAKAQALSKLQDLAPDIALYEKEKKRSAKKDPSVPWGGKRAADQIDRERTVARSSSPAQRNGDGEEDEDGDVEMQDARRPAKRQKSSLPDIDMRICLTGYKRWVLDKSKEDAERVSRAITVYSSR